MSLYRRYRILWAAGLAVSVLGYGLLVYGVYLLVDVLLRLVPVLGAAGSLGALARILYEALMTPLAFVFAGLFVGYLAGLLRSAARRAWDEYVKTLIGYIEARGAVTLQELAARFEVEPRQLEELLAKLRAEGVFKGYIGGDGVVYASHAAPAQAGYAAPQRQEVEPGEPGEVAHAEADEVRVPLESFETLESPGAAAGEAGGEPGGGVEDEMRRLEEMYRRGLISEETYREMLEKLRRSRGG